ncbi:DUF4129 domain-containing protein [Paenibacillus senegalensis]|uniref:DUF4129 domain-containing protein n=1 Tax=Paenibacillus senegalensis TaxID=1465766 RepID=UPI0002890F85|nr:DUF4129 domain-containing protein [Paenibacillus senegalensis]
MHKLRAVLKAFGHGVIEMILFMPLLLLLPIYLAPAGTMAIWLLLLSAGYLAGAVFVIGLHMRRKWQQFLGAVLLAFLLALNIIGTTLWGYITVVLLVIVILRGVYMAYRQINQVYPELFYFIGPGLYFLTAIFYSRLEELNPYATFMFWLGLLSLLICLFFSNRVHLQWTSITQNRNQNQEGQQKLNKGLLLHNRILLLGLLLIIVIASLLRQIQQGLAWLYSQLVEWVNRLLASDPVEPLPETEPGAPSSPDFGYMEPAEPHPFFVWLEKAVQAVFYVIMIAVILILLFWLGKRLIRLAGWLSNWLNSRMDRKGEDSPYTGYVDEEEVLDGGWKPFAGATAERMRSWMDKLRNREAAWEALSSNRERARYLFRHYIRSRPSRQAVRESATPREAAVALSGQYPENQEAIKKLAESYEQARYGDKEPREDLEQIRRELNIK